MNIQQGDLVEVCKQAGSEPVRREVSGVVMQAEIGGGDWSVNRVEFTDGTQWTPGPYSDYEGPIELIGHALDLAEAEPAAKAAEPSILDLIEAHQAASARQSAAMDELHRLAGESAKALHSVLGRLKNLPVVYERGGKHFVVTYCGGPCPYEINEVDIVHE